jgi:hypothetical protein
MRSRVLTVGLLFLGLSVGLASPAQAQVADGPFAHIDAAVHEAQAAVAGAVAVLEGPVFDGLGSGIALSTHEMAIARFNAFVARAEAYSGCREDGGSPIDCQGILLGV